MNANINEILSSVKEFGQENTELLITVGACFVVLMIVLCSRPKKQKEDVPAQVPVVEPEKEEKAEEVNQNVMTEGVSLEDEIQVEKIELANYEFEKDVSDVKFEVKEQLDNLEKLKVAVDSSNEQEGILQQIGNMGMKVCGNSDRLESVEIKIEKAQIIFKYRDNSCKAESDVKLEIGQAAEDVEKMPEEKKEVESAPSYTMSDEIGKALKKQAELENRKFGPGNMNVSHSGRVFSEEELNDLIKD